VAISLNKTLVGTAYTLYFVSTILVFDGEKVVTEENGWQSQTHYTEGFFPMVRRVESLIGGNLIDIMNAMYPDNYTVCIGAVDNYLVASVPYYSGGTVVS